MFDFDLTLEQARASAGRKWHHYDADVIPSWIADMDFPVAQPIRDFIHTIATSGDLGYSADEEHPRVRELFAARMAQRYQWQLRPQDVDTMTDIVQSIHIAVRVLCNDNERVIINTPCYHPILTACRTMGRDMLFNPLVEVDGQWQIDFEQLEAAIDASVKLLILVNPHNPSGRCFRRDELIKFADLALRHNLYVVADEVHCDLVFADAGRHIPFASLGPEIAARTVTFNSATKSHNMGGVRFCVAHYGNTDIQQRFAQFPPRFRGGENLIGNRATQIAWEQCEQWLQAVVAYLQGNRDYLAHYLKARLPMLHHLPNQATYLAWIDCSGLGLTEDAADFFLREAKVGVYSGHPFAGSKDCIRLNFATSRQILEQKLARIRAGVGRL